MNVELIKTKFEEIGARVKFVETTRFRDGMPPNLAISIDVLKDRKGEFFAISERQTNTPFEVAVIDAKVAERHLLLMLKQGKVGKETVSKFLCGHDERQWFTCAVPEAAGAKNVLDAMEALKPESVVNAQKGTLKKKHLEHAGTRRKNEVYIRQGEWFFTKANIDPNPKLIHKNEPITNGRRGAKPHICEELYRTGGTTVMVHRSYAPNGLTLKEFHDQYSSDKDKLGWRQMTRDAQVYVRGYIRHSDHKTINLKGWYSVRLNREQEAKASRAVAFLD